MKTAKYKINNLVVYRRRRGLSQKQVAILLGQRDTSMISHYEHGRALPPLPVALSLEIIYRVPVAFLFPAMYEQYRDQIRRHEEQLAAPGHTRLFSLLLQP